MSAALVTSQAAQGVVQLAPPHEIWCPLVCDVAKSAAKSGFQEVIGSLAKGALELLKVVGTFWMKVPDPQVAGNGAPVRAIGTLTSAQKPFVAVFSAIGLLFAMGKVVWENRAAQHGRDIMRGLLVLVVSSALTLTVFQALLEAGDAFSPWILQQATGDSNANNALNTILEAMLPTAVTTGGASISGAWFVLALLLILGAGVQLVFMVIRGAVLYILAAFLPAFAATSFSEEGWMRFKRAILLMFAFVLYKPVAAIIYAVGFELLEAPQQAGDSGSNSLMTGIYALTILVLAALALPSLIKFLVPMAASGSSAAFSGGAALAVIGAGAAAVATMGGSAAAAGAAGSGGVTQEAAGGLSGGSGGAATGGGTGGFSGFGTGGDGGASGGAEGSATDLAAGMVTDTASSQLGGAESSGATRGASGTGGGDESSATQPLLGSSTSSARSSGANSSSAGSGGGASSSAPLPTGAAPGASGTETPSPGGAPRASGPNGSSRSGAQMAAQAVQQVGQHSQQIVPEESGAQEVEQ